MNEVTIQPTELVVEDAMIHALQELKKLKEGQSILSADVDYLKNEQPVNPSICLALEKLRKKKVVPCSVVKTARPTVTDISHNPYFHRLLKTSRTTSVFHATTY